MSGTIIAASIFSGLSSSMRMSQQARDISIANHNIARNNAALLENAALGTEINKRNLIAAEDDSVRQSLAIQLAKRKAEGEAAVLAGATGVRGSSGQERTSRNITAAAEAAFSANDRELNAARVNTDLAQQALIRNAQRQYQQPMNQQSSLSKLLNIGVGVGKGALMAGLI